MADISPELINNTLTDVIKKHINNYKIKIYNIGPIKTITGKYDNLEDTHKKYIDYILLFVLVGIIISSILKTIKMAIYVTIFGIIALGGYTIHDRYIKPEKKL